MKTTDTHYSVFEISKELGLSVPVIRKRIEKQCIEPCVIKGKYYYTEYDVEKIMNSKKERRDRTTPTERFTVIEYFLNNNNNTTPEIAKICPLPFYLIDRIIFEFYKNDKCVIVKSRL